VDDVALDSSEVDGLFKGFDNTVITGRQLYPTSGATSLPLRKSVFDVIQGGVDQNTTIIPSSRLDPDRLVDQSTLDKRLVGDGNG